MADPTMDSGEHPSEEDIVESERWGAGPEAAPPGGEAAGGRRDAKAAASAVAGAASVGDEGEDLQKQVIR
jgi:hypothetical protein